MKIFKNKVKIFKNSVCRYDVDIVDWAAAAGIRAVKTMAQTAASGIATATIMADVDWLLIFSTATLAGVLSVLTSIAGLPEVKAKDKEDDEHE